MNDELRLELLDMAEADLTTRRRLIDAGQLYGPHLPEDWYHPDMAAVHRYNNARLGVIIEQVGFPGRRLVGEDGCEAAWRIAQHAILDPNLQARCLPLLKQAMDDGDAPAQHYAMLLDRLRFGKGEPQVYGSIFVGGVGGLVPWTIEDPEKVDERRAAVGLRPLSIHTETLQSRVEEEARVQHDAKNGHE